MTFVKAKLKLDELQKGDLLDILLMEGEPLRQVEKSSLEQGFQLNSIKEEGNGVYRMMIEK